MSEFKYACPVCGQHMMCDTSQGGSVMECPTCFQKIVAPQAPTSTDNKLILTGTKFTEKRTSDPFAGSAGARQEKRPYVAVIIFLVILAAAAAAIFKYHDQLLQYASAATGQPVVSTNPPANQAAAPVPPLKPEKPVAVAPPANDTNWTLTLDGVTNFPDTPVAGRIHGQDFIIERASFVNGTLTFRDATRGTLVFGCSINFGGAPAEALSGKSINVTTNADTAARVTLHWKDDDVSSKASFDSGYAMQLQFGTLEKNHLPGKIYLCTPDPQKTYLLGTFNADARKPKPKAPKN